MRATKHASVRIANEIISEISRIICFGLSERLELSVRATARVSAKNNAFDQKTNDSFDEKKELVSQSRSFFIRW